jgi:hypothetical protein
VYLIDNKEESLNRARQRIDKLQMDNIVLYQVKKLERRVAKTVVYKGTM